MARLAGKVALVSGAGAGIGRAIARLFAHEGASVAVLDVDERRSADTAEVIAADGGRALGLVADVSDDAAVGDAVKTTVRELGPLGLLVNNAAIWLEEDGAIAELEPTVWARTLDVNLTGVYHCCRHGVPELLTTGGGSIVNISSPVALRPERAFDAYTASKGAILSLTRSMAQCYAVQGVRVNALLPGAVMTAMTDDAFALPEYRARALAHTPLGRLGEPEDVALAALYLASDEASFVTGAVLAVDGGWLVAE